MDFYEQEDRNGIRFSWNLLPYNKQQAEKLTIPVGFLYTPIKEIENMEFLGSQPVKCQKCKSILNPRSALDVQKRAYQCNFCQAQNALPSHYADFLSQGHQLPECDPMCETIEYLINEDTLDIGYLFVIDKCLPLEELSSIKETMLATLETLPDEVNVGIISYDKNIIIHDLSVTSFLAESALNGSKNYSYERLAHLLGFALPTAPSVSNNHKPSPGLARFIKPLSECRDLVNRIIDNINIDKSIMGKFERVKRATGAALKVAIGMGKGWFQHVRIQVFIFPFS